MSFTARLEETSLGTLTLDDGLIVALIDLGFPEIREVSDPRADVDGADDRTVLHGARSVTIQAVVHRTSTSARRDVYDRLLAFCRPGLRPWLYVDEGEGERRVRLRADQLSAPISNPAFSELQASWRAPDGIVEAADLQVVDISASTEDEAGRSYDLTFDRTYPESAAVGSATVVNAGTTDAWPIIRVYGPCDDPRLISDTQDAEVTFVGLTVAAGEYLEVDMRERTARIDGKASASRLARLDFALSSWWPLSPGANLVRFAPASFSGASLMQIRYRSAWL